MTIQVSHKSEMAGPFNRGDTMINKHFTIIVYLKTFDHFRLMKFSGSSHGVPVYS